MTSRQPHMATAPDVAALQRFCLKIYAHPGDAVDARAAIPVFHRWIREQAVPGLLIDVADYCHLPTGPQALLVAHEAHYAIDGSGGRTGLAYTRRQPADGPLPARLAAAARALLTAGQLLERDAAAAPRGRFTFRGDEITVTSNDRLRAPAEPAVAAALRAAVTELAARLFDGRCTVEPLDVAGRTGCHARALEPASLDVLLKRLA